MSSELEAHLRKIIRRDTYKKGDVILQLGAVCSQIFYIESGLVWSFHRHNGEEVSNWFMMENDICIAVLSFFRQAAANEAHIALEDCVCWGISYAELQEAYILFPEFRLHGQNITEEYYCRSEERREDINMKSAQERYEILMGKYPTLALRVPNKHLASYLGVKERTFNDMRKKYSDKKKPATRKKKA